MSKTYLVGGAVRDLILGKQPHDVDYVIVGSTIEEMLEKGFKQVSKGFPVFLHPETGDEYALARKEIKTGDKHTDFEFVFTPDTTLYEDMQRRDFTMNAMARDIETGEIIDYFGGQSDIKSGIIRHVNTEHFVEDPLRVLRAARQATEHDFTIASETMDLLTQMVKDGMLEHLTPERVWKEIEKALNTPRFDKFITILDIIGALPIILPEVAALKEVPENELYHPEGNTFKHVILTLRQVQHQFSPFGIYDERCTEPRMALLNFGLLCHDLGKVLFPHEWPAHHGHEAFGLPIVQKLCDRLKVPNEYRETAYYITQYHMKYYEFLKSKIKKQYDVVREVTNNFRYFDKLSLLHFAHCCDLCGREGTIAQERIDNYYNVTKRMNNIFKVMENVTLETLPEETQKQLSKFKGIVFGQRYREAMIRYLKNKLREVEV